ncbi:MAG: T9SS type A sorting domain-containing protein [Bacteroidia bacterium]
MKKIFTLFLVFSLLKVVAQLYQKMLADSATLFTVVDLTMGVKPNPGNNTPLGANCLGNVWAGDWIAQNDSIYNGLSYKKLYNYNMFYGLLREDSSSKKVFFIPYCDISELLLYDFSLSVGGTINYTFYYGGGGFPSGTYKVDSIKLKHDYKTYYRRHFYLKNHSSAGNPTLELIEGVGSANHPIFLYGSFMAGDLSWSAQYCPSAKYNLLVSCKSDNGEKVYYDSCAYKLAVTASCVHVSDSCNYNNTCTDIKEFGELSNLSVFPNPASEIITLEIESQKELFLTYSLISVLGIEVRNEKSLEIKKGKNSAQLNVRDIPEGIYILRLSSGEKSGGKTIVISR